MSIWRMIDTVLAAAANAPFQPADLRHQPIMARQDNLAAVEAWQQVPIQIALRLLAQFVADAVLVEWLLHELAAVVVTNHFGNAVGLEQLGEFVNNDRRTEWRPHLAYSVNSDPIVRPRLVRDRQRHSIRATAAGRVDESAIARAARRQLLAVVTNATFNDFERDEALDVRAELPEILRRGAGAVLLQRTVDDALRQGWIERPARTVSHEDERVATCAVVALEHLPQHAPSRVWTGGQDQRTTGRRQAGLNCVQDLDIRVGVGCVHVPEGQLVGDDGDVRGATQLAERRRADLQGNAVGQLQRVCRSVHNQLLEDRTVFEAGL